MKKNKSREAVSKMPEWMRNYRLTSNSPKKVDATKIILQASERVAQDRKTIENLQFHNRGLAVALREKHNRDVELTDLLAELAERYAHVFTPDELARIDELVRPLNPN